MALLDLIEQKSFLGPEFLTWLWHRSETTGGPIDLGEKLGSVEVEFENTLTLEAEHGEAVLQTLRGEMPGLSGEAGAAPEGGDGLPAGGRYIVFVLGDGGPRAVGIRTGLTDLDFSEVIEGLSESDSVLMLPSAGLVRSQQRFQERIRRFTGDGLPGVRSRDR